MLSNPCLLGDPQCQRRGGHQKWLPHRFLFGVQKRAIPSRGSLTPRAGRKSEEGPPLPSRGPRRGHFILRGSQCQAREDNQKWLPHPCCVRKRAEMISNSCILGGSPTPSVGRKSEVAASPLPSRGRKRGRKCYVTTPFSGLPNAKRGEKIRSAYLTHAWFVTQKRAEVLHNPCILRGTNCQARGENQKWLPHPCLSRGAYDGGSATQPLHSRRYPTPSEGQKAQVPASALPSRGLKRGRKCYVTIAFSVVPHAKRGEKIRKGYLRPAF